MNSGISESSSSGPVDHAGLRDDLVFADFLQYFSLMIRICIYILGVFTEKPYSKPL